MSGEILRTFVAIALYILVIGFQGSIIFSDWWVPSSTWSVRRNDVL